MSPVRQIATRFVMTGFTNIRDAFARLGNAIRDFARNAAAKLGGIFKGALASVKKFSIELAKVSFTGILRGAKYAFAGIAAAAGLAALKVTAISVAAIRASEEMADYLHMLDTVSKQTGSKVGDIATLRYAAEQNGGDPEELLPTLSNIATAFGDVNKSINDANSAYEKTRNWSKTGLAYALGNGDWDGAQGFLDQTSSARMGSLEGIGDRKAQIQQAVMDTDQGGASYQRALMQTGSARAAEAQMSQQRIALVSEFKELDQAEYSVRQGLGPVGQAFDKLKEQGLDMNAVMRGGTDSLYALADALEKIPDSNEKLRIAGQLFGGDSGSKNLALLTGGRAAIDQYKADMERFGALPTDDDAKMGTDLKKSEGRRRIAIQGLKLTISREIDPMLEQANDRLAEFIAKNRDVIAKVVKTSFDMLEKIFSDTLKLLDGNTDFESALFKKGFQIAKLAKAAFDYIKALAQLAMDEIKAVLNGEQSDWPWLNTLRDVFVSIAGWAVSTFEYVAKVAMDAFTTVKTFATDAYDVITGGNATTYQQMNKVRDAVVDFAGKLQDAFNMFMQVVDAIHAAIKPILDLFGVDVTTFVLFLGMARFSGLLGGLVGILKLIGPLFVGLFSGIGAGAAGAISAISGIGLALTGALGVGAVAGGYFAQKMLNQNEDTWNKRADTEAEKMKMADDVYMDNKMDVDPVFRANFWASQGIGAHIKTPAENAADAAAYSNGSVLTPSDNDPLGIWAGRTNPITRVVNMNFGGTKATLYGTDDADDMLAAANRLARQGGL